MASPLGKVQIEKVNDRQNLINEILHVDRSVIILHHALRILVLEILLCVEHVPVVTPPSLSSTFE